MPEQPITRLEAIEILTSILHDFVMRRHPTIARNYLRQLLARLDATDVTRGDWVQ